MSKLKLSLFIIFAFSFAVKAQESLGTYQIRVAPERADWTYELNQTAKFDVAVTLNNRQVAGFPPGIYSFGYNDEVYPPTSVYAAYNVIVAPKKLLLGLEMGHNNSPEQGERINKWIEDFLKPGKAD